jgi:hypothetical protein
MLLERGGSGDQEQAAEMLQEALAAYAAYGMPSYAAEVQRLMEQLRASS